MLFRVFCVPCRLSTLWTDDPVGFLRDTCNHPRRCEALLSDEDFPSLHSRSTVTALHHTDLRRRAVLPSTEPDPPRAEQHVKLTP